jgi:hypothetical protein
MAAPIYEIRIAGLISQEKLVDLPDVLLSEQELRTVLTGSFEDQAALHGFLHRLRSLGLELIEVRSLPDTNGD